MEENEGAIIGITVLGFAAVLQLVSLLLMRVLVKLKQGGHISTMRTWLYLGTALEQSSFIVFHVKYNFFNPDFEMPDTCIVLRFLQAFCSTFTAMWMLIIACFYLVLTIKPEKCFTFNSRFLSHCVVWSWSCVSCLMYLVLAFLIKEEQHLDYVEMCWRDIAGTIHMFNTYGNEVIPLFVAYLFISSARYRISGQKARLETFMRHSECNVTFSGLLHGISRYIVLLSFMVVYYVVLVFRFLLNEQGSDLILMLIQASRGILISLLTCLLDGDVLALLRGRKHQPEVSEQNFRAQKGPDVEMHTYIFRHTYQ